MLTGGRGVLERVVGQAGAAIGEPAEEQVADICAKDEVAGLRPLAEITVAPGLPGGGHRLGHKGSRAVQVVGHVVEPEAGQRPLVAQHVAADHLRRDTGRIAVDPLVPLDRAVFRDVARRQLWRDGKCQVQQRVGPDRVRRLHILGHHADAPELIVDEKAETPDNLAVLHVVERVHIRQRQRDIRLAVDRHLHAAFDLGEEKIDVAAQLRVDVGIVILHGQQADAGVHAH